MLLQCGKILVLLTEVENLNASSTTVQFYTKQPVFRTAMGTLCVVLLFPASTEGSMMLIY